LTLILVAAGVASVLGDGLTATHAALADGRASGVRRLLDYRGADFQPQRAAFMDWPATRRQGVAERLQNLMVAALRDVVVSASAAGWIGQHGYDLAVALPELSGIDEVGAAAALAAAAVVGAHPLKVSVHLCGGAGVAEALAQRRLAGETAGLLVLTADSFASEARLNSLNDAGRLFSAQNPWGLVPGEAGVALLFVPEGAGLAVLGAGVAVEMEGEDDAKDSDYQGLTVACRGALEGVEMQVVAWETDCNNARYRAAEMSYTALRLGQRLAAECQVRHLSAALGDTGAALPGLALALHWQGGALAGPVLITGAGQASGRRGAIVVAKVRGGTDVANDPMSA
jgi:hypothetical protein